jgi:hypothetical protein
MRVIRARDEPPFHNCREGGHIMSRPTEWSWKAAKSQRRSAIGDDYVRAGHRVNSPQAVRGIILQIVALVYSA